MSGMLDILIAFIVIFLIFSIVVSGLQEWWAQFFGHRGRFLRMGMQRLISDDAIFVRVLQHPLVGSLYRDRAARGKPPSYIEPTNFALAFADVVLRRAAAGGDAGSDALEDAPATLDFDNLRNAVAKLRLQHSSAALAVLPIIEQARGDLPAALKGIEDWFNNGMDRVTGWYKAYAQRRLFVWGFVVACLCNVDTIELYRALNRSPALTAQLATIGRGMADSGSVAGVDLKDRDRRPFTADEAKAVMESVLANAPPSLPIGYACLGAVAKADALTSGAAPSGPSGSDTVAATAQASVEQTLRNCRDELRDRVRGTSLLAFLLQLIGWTLTALAGVLGAPYWFGLLTKVVEIRGSGPRPVEKKTTD